MRNNFCQPTFDARTTTAATFKQPTAHALQPPEARKFEIKDGMYKILFNFVSDIEKHILFGHGQDTKHSSYVTMNQLVHSNPFVQQGLDASMKTETAFKGIAF